MSILLYTETNKNETAIPFDPTGDATLIYNGEKYVTFLET